MSGKRLQGIPTGLAGLSAFFVVLFIGGLIGVAVGGAHRGAWLGVLAVAVVGAVVCGLVIRRSSGARRIPT